MPTVKAAVATASAMAASTLITVFAGWNKGSSLGLICHGLKAATARNMIVSGGNECAGVILRVQVGWVCVGMDRKGEDKGMRM